MTNFDLIAAKMEAVKRDMLLELNRNIFAGIVGVAARPLTRRARLTRRLALVRGYFSTLWKAIKGDELVEPYDEDY